MYEEIIFLLVHIIAYYHSSLQLAFSIVLSYHLFITEIHTNCYIFINHGFNNSTKLCSMSEVFLVTTTQLCVRPELAISPSLVGIDFHINSAAP